MVRISSSVAALILVAVSSSTQPRALSRSRAVVLEHAELKATPAALLFNRKGDLYVGYRDRGAHKRSSSIWVRVFDPDSGRELRSAQLQTPTVRLPNGVEQFFFSPDESLLVLSQFHGNSMITILRATDLKTISETSSLPRGIEKEFPKAVAIDTSDASLLLAAEQPNRRNGVDIRLVRLDVHHLEHVVSDSTLANPIAESGYTVDATGEVWIVKANALYRFDVGRGEAALETSIHDQDDIRGVLFLKHSSLLMWSDQNEFGYLYRYEQDDMAADRSQRINKCGVKQVAVSPDELFGVALCEHQNLGEWHFGAITDRAAVIFDTKTLKIIAQVPVKKDLYPELALWHGDGKIILATQSDSDKLAIFQFPVPASTGKQGADSTMPLCLHGGGRSNPRGQ